MESLYYTSDCKEFSVSISNLIWNCELGLPLEQVQNTFDLETTHCEIA